MASIQFVPGAGMAASNSKIIFASQIQGVSLDCDLNTGAKIGGGTATDNTTALNAVLATGVPNAPVVLIIDGPSAVTGLFLPTLGHASIIGLGWDTGFFLKSGSAQDVIHNGNATYQQPTAPIINGTPLPARSTRGANVILRDFQINGNLANVTRIGVGGTVFYMGIALKNLDNITIENIYLHNCPTFHIGLSNCGHSNVRGCRIVADGQPLNTDGIHIFGGSNDTTITNTYFSVGDDPVTCGAPEGYGGDIINTTVIGCTMDNCFSFCRIYAAVDGAYAASFNIYGVKYIGCQFYQLSSAGQPSFPIFLGDTGAGNSVPGIADGIRDVLFHGCVFYNVFTDLAGVTNSIASLIFSDCTIISPQAAKAWVNMSQNISSLTFENCKVYRNTLGSSGTYLMVGNGTVGTLTIDGYGIQDQVGQTFSSAATVFNGFNGTITRAIINALDLNHYSGLSNNLPALTSVTGAGVRSLGVEFADGQIVNGTDYLSATSHLPSIKISGVVKTYTVT